MKTLAKDLFMEGNEPVWKVTYRHGPMTIFVEVRAANEETAIMRAGMKRSEVLTPKGWRQWRFGRRTNWERLAVEKVS